MGVMWDYFKGLGWNLIQLRSGALTMLAEGGGAALDDARQAILWLRDQFNPETCETAYLDAHARSRGVTRAPREPDDKYKARVVKAFPWHFQGGKRLGLPEILKLYGYDATVIPYRTIDPDRWAEFLVEVERTPDTTSEDRRLLLWAVNDQKQAAAKLAELRFVTSLPVASSLTASLSAERLQELPMRLLLEDSYDVTPADTHIADLSAMGLSLETSRPLAFSILPAASDRPGLDAYPCLDEVPADFGPLDLTMEVTHV